MWIVRVRERSEGQGGSTGNHEPFMKGEPLNALSRFTGVSRASDRCRELLLSWVTDVVQVLASGVSSPRCLVLA